jgi:hypothetical protein
MSDAALAGVLIEGADGERVSIVVHSRTHPHALDFWDGNWLQARVEIQVGAWRGHYTADLRVEEFSRFRLQLERLGRGQPGHAEFSSMEYWLTLTVRIEETGGLSVSGTACDRPGTGNSLTFTFLHGAVTDVQEIARQLKRLVSKFPQRGSPNDAGPPG